jgi:photosystem II stability/assembly factor-like uncharacterized protein
VRQIRKPGIAAVLVFLLVSVLPSLAQQVDPAVFAGMRWRLVGPFRGGRALTATGVPGDPHLFYFGSVGGGVWKSTDAGNTWEPIFDEQKIASIGAVAVAPSDPNVIYVGTGEADMRSQISYGNGMYKSSDGGRTWTHIGLEDSQQIGRILVDPKNPDVVLVAVLGHAYAASSERGVFRSINGGKTWERVLHKDDDTGAIDLAFDPRDSRVIYATLWQTRRPPWNIYPASNGPGSGLYKSTDGGGSWEQLSHGLPTQGLGRMGVAVAPSDPGRVYAIVDAKDGGLYRSDDAGASWRRTDNEARIWGRGWYFGVVAVDPSNPDVVYVSNTTIYKSVDGGKSFTAFKGAPGGDDYHGLWIAPDDPRRIIVASDQGTVVTLNGGKTWSSWYNQPTAQLYHVATDQRFPYWLYGAQQDSGAIAVPSRSDYASITGHDWGAVVVAGESGMIAPDPLHPGIVFGGEVSRYDVVTSQDQDVSPTIGRPGPFRRTWTLPIAFSPADPHKLYFSRQFLYRSLNGGKSWEQISPDLTRENPGAPANLDPITAGYGLASPRKGVIYSIAPSPLDANLLWVGTDDGLIHRSADDGKHWTDVTPKEVTAWSKVATLEASHFSALSAYAAVDRHRLDDRKPYIYRTHDGGKSWQMAAKGIPDGSWVNVIREDPVRRGLLYAGTELGIYVSFNDGDDWQPLQLNLPVSSVRDITIHGSDLVIATHGRSFWVLDDIEPLREAKADLAAEPVHLFRPAAAVRVRPGSDQGTPYPAEIPHGDNPPAGAILDYWLKDAPTGPITLELLDRKGGVVRSYHSDDKVPAVDEKTLIITLDWVHPAQPPSAAPGMHRFVWDLRYAAPAPARGASGFRRSGGPWVTPGTYTVRLTVDGKSFTQPLVVKLDPRVKAAPLDLEAQLVAGLAAAARIKELSPEVLKGTAMEKQLKDLAAKATNDGALSSALADFSRRLLAVLGPPPLTYGEPVLPLETDQTSLRHLLAGFTEVMNAVESADAAPTVEQESALRQDEKTFAATMPEWKKLLADLPALNAQLKQAGLPEITTNPKP